MSNRIKEVNESKKLIKSDIVLDIDGVLIDFVSGVFKFAKENDKKDHLYYDHPSYVDGWHFYHKSLWGDFYNREDFWRELPAHSKSSDLRFEPSYYLTCRPIDSTVTTASLRNNGFPVPDKVVSVVNPENKVHIIVNSDLILVDDKFETVFNIIQSGGKAILFLNGQNRGNPDIGLVPYVESLNQLSIFVERGIIGKEKNK